MVVVMPQVRNAPPAPLTSPMVFCRVTIRMPDGSRGQHADWYAGTFDAWERARNAFPGAKSISVVAVRGVRSVS